MSSEESKLIMARNIQRCQDIKGVTNQQLCDDLGFKYTTFMDWKKAVTYPRIGKIEAMANYFGVLKSDLIEDKGEAHFEMLQEVNELNDIMSWIKSDSELLRLMKKLRKAPEEKKILHKSMLAAITESIED